MDWIEKLRQGAAGADRTLQAVRDELPDGLGVQVWAAAIRSGTLTVLVSSAAWATRIRYHTPDLREKVSPAPRHRSPAGAGESASRGRNRAADALGRPAMDGTRRVSGCQAARVAGDAAPHDVAATGST